MHVGVCLRISFHVVKSVTKNNDEINKIRTSKLLLYPYLLKRIVIGSQELNISSVSFYGEK